MHRAYNCLFLTNNHYTHYAPFEMVNAITKLTGRDVSKVIRR